MSQAETLIPAGAVTSEDVVAAALASAEAVRAQAVALADADKDFESAMSEVAQGIARILGTSPTYDGWEAVQKAFIADYADARKCKEETARQRWVAVCKAMESEYALEKPAKPTKAAEAKAAQRKGAAEQAAELVKAAGAATPQAILALTTPAKGQPAPSAPVIAALSKIAGEAAKESAKAATEAAKEEAKRLRESIRKECQTLTNPQLRKVAALIAKLRSEGQPTGEGDEGEGDAPDAEGTTEVAAEGAETVTA